MATPGPPQLVLRPRVRNQRADFYWGAPAGGSTVTSYTLSNAGIPYRERYGPSSFYVSLTNSNIVPTDICGCVLWLDAADSATLFQSTTGPTGPVTADGDPVRLWLDKSGTGNHASTPTSTITYSTTGFNGKPAVYFANNPMYLNPSTLANGPATYFFATKQLTATNWQFLGHGGGNGQYQRFYYQSGLRFNYIGGTIALDPSTVQNVNVITSAQYGPVRSYAFRFGTAFSTTGTAFTWAVGTSTATIGYDSANGPGPGLISEMIAYNGTLNDLDRQRIEGYLAAKWGVQSSFSVTHPYYTGAPPPSALPRQFQPTDIPGCSLWFDAADPAFGAARPTNGSTLSLWRDKSGKGRDAVTTGSAPTYSTTVFNGAYPALYFSNTPLSISTLGLSKPSRISLYAVLQQTGYTGSGNNVIFAGNPSSFLGLLGFQASNNLTFQFNGQATYNVLTTSFSNSSLLIGAVGHSTNITGYLNGTQVVSSAYTSNASFLVSSPTQYLISPGAFVGPICEIIAYEYDHNNADRQRVEGYLAKKWGLAAQLSTTHPYVTAAVPQTCRAGFSPAVDVAGCRLWLDALDTSTLTISTTIISSWLDKSGLGYHFTQSTAAQCPTISSLNLLRALNFNGTGANSLFLSNTALTYPSSAYTVFAVGRQNTNATTTGTYFSLFHTGAAASTTMIGASTNGVYASFAGTGAAFNDVTANTASFSTRTNVSILGITVSTTSLTPYYNGVAQTAKTGTTSSVLGALLGDAPGFARNWSGQIGEVLVYGSTLSTDNRQRVEGYLAWKWGSQSTLGATHPYSLAPPVSLRPMNNASSYTFTLAASNDVGLGPAASFRTIQPGIVPYGPSTVSVDIINSTTMRVFWYNSTIPSTGTITSYVIKAIPSTVAMSTIRKCAYNYQSTQYMTGLSTNTSYQFLVQAVTDAGLSASNAFAYTSTTLLSSFTSTIVNGSNMFMAAGMYPTITAATRPYLIQRSADGINWVSSVAVGSSTFSGQYCKGGYNGSNHWVWSGGSAYGGFIYSSDGFNWKGCLGGVPSGTGYFTYYNPYKNLWIGGGNGGQSSNSLQWSSDGITWNPSRTNLSWFYGWGAAYSSTLDIYVALGYGGSAAAWSTDGSNWTAASTNGATIGFSVVWNEYINKFVAGFNPGGTWSTVQTSTDGKTFTNAIPSATITNLGTMAVGYNSSITLVGGNNIYQSADAVTWVVSKVGSIAEVADFKYNSNIGKWIAIGTNNATTADRLKYSGNGCNWSNPTYTNFSSMNQQSGGATSYTYNTLSTIII